MTKQLKLGALFLALVASGAAMADSSFNNEKYGYTISQQSREVVRSNYEPKGAHECWENSFLNAEVDRLGLVECGDRQAEAPAPADPTSCLVLTNLTCALKLAPLWMSWLSA